MHLMWTLVLAFNRRQWHGEGTFFDGQSAQAISVQVTIEDYGISIRRDGSEYTYSPKDLLFTEKRAEGYVRIELKPLKGAVLVLNDAEALEAFIANGYFKTRVFSRLPTKIKLPYVIGALIVLVVFFFTFGLDFIVDRSVDLISEENEAALGRKVFNEIAKGQSTADDSELVAILDKCAGIVQKFDPTRDFNVKITVIEDTDIKNAFALPGGQIVVYRGILEVMTNEHELFGLLAHEAGHINLRHGLRRIARTTIIGVLFTVLLGDATGLSAIIIDNSSLLLNLAYNRKEEAAADEYAMLALRKAGMNEEGLMSLFEKIKEKEYDVKWLTYLSSHPPTETRIEFLRENIQPNESYKSILTRQEWEILRKGSK